MFDKLEDLLIRFDELLNMLNDPSVIGDPQRFQKLMKEQSSLQPIVDTYKEYKNCRQTIEESLSMLEEESDEEMRDMLKEELADARRRIEELEQKLKILCCRRIRMMTRTLSSRSVRAQAEMRRHCLRPRYIGCMYTMLRVSAGVSRQWMSRRSVSVA